MDWYDTGYTYEIGVNAVHQTDVDNTLGSLSGIQLSGMTITENYNSDSRIQAKVSTVVPKGTSDGYVENARLRIILMIPEFSWSEELITGYVSDINEETKNGYIKRTYTIEGTLWGILDHTIDTPVIIGTGSSLIKVWSALMRNLTKIQIDTDEAQDHRFGSTVIYEAGSKLGTVEFEISSGYNRMDNDGHGRVTLKKYTTPANQSPSRIIDTVNQRGIHIEPVSKTSTTWDAPGRAVVTATVTREKDDGSSVQEVIVGSYDAPTDDPSSIAVRGWLKGISESYSGASEIPSKSELNEAAKKKWSDNQDKGNQWELNSVFADYHAGEVVSLILPSTSLTQSLTSEIERLNNVETHKVLITGVRTDLESFTQELTLKEV